MSRRGLIDLPPTRADLAVARGCVRYASPPLERTLRVVTWLADEKIILGGVVAFWAYARLAGRQRSVLRQADHLLCSAAIAGALPHLFKYLVNRERPDRTVGRGRRRGIPRSGEAFDSFPSGHALHVGAIGRPLRRLLPGSLRPLVWPTGLALAGSRLMLLAHYLSDVAAGLVLGLMVDRGVGVLLRTPGENPSSSQPVHGADTGADAHCTTAPGRRGAPAFTSTPSGRVAASHRSSSALPARRRRPLRIPRGTSAAR